MFGWWEMITNQAFHDVTVNAYDVTVNTHHRSLQNASGGGSGTLAILIIVSILFCLVWTPTIFRRCGFPSYRDRLEAEQAEAEAIRAVLQAGEHLPDFSAPYGMTVDDRREYVQNILVTKHVRIATEPLSNHDSRQNHVLEEGQETIRESKERRKSDLFINPPTLLQRCDKSNEEDEGGGGGGGGDLDYENDEEQGGKNEATDDAQDDDGRESCPICLTEYKEGDEICWSQNRSCYHVFHQECIVEWLLRHDDCPCCRHNFLSLDDSILMEDQTWGNTNLFWTPVRIPPLPRIDADEEEFWNRIHEFRHFARRYLNPPYQPNSFGTALDFPPPYLTRTARLYPLLPPTSGVSIFQLDDPGRSISQAPGRFRYGGGLIDLELSSGHGSAGEESDGHVNSNTEEGEGHVNSNRDAARGLSICLGDQASVASSLSSDAQQAHSSSIVVGSSGQIREIGYDEELSEVNLDLGATEAAPPGNQISSEQSSRPPSDEPPRNQVADISVVETTKDELSPSRNTFDEMLSDNDVYTAVNGTRNPSAELVAVIPVDTSNGGSTDNGNGTKRNDAHDGCASI